MTPRVRSSLLALAAAAVVATTSPGFFQRAERATPVSVDAGSGGGATALAVADSYGPCDFPVSNAVATANDILVGRLTLSHFGPVTVPLDPRWNENPVHDPNWEFNFHSLRFLDALWAAYRQTHDRRYRARYIFLLRDWFGDNPRSNPPSRYSWNDHAAAWRGVVYACALGRLPHYPWLVRAALEHGGALADDHFYVHHGNHALNQSVGLLALGCVIGDASWRDLAHRRIETLARESIDARGVINEQAVGYQWYNFVRYRDAVAHLRWCHVAPSRGLVERVDAMAGFLAFGTLPNGRWDLIGDTLDDGPGIIPGTPFEFAASRGRSGAPPSSIWATYQAGFAFVRSGWGETRSFTDETALCLRFGPGRIFHGHVDPASLTLYSLGDRILIDPGMYHFTRDRWRTWFASAAAHNTVTADGVDTAPTGATTLIGERHTAAYDFLAVRHRKIPGVVATRRVLYVRALDAVVVEDDLTADAPRTFHQWWHLHPAADPVVDGRAIYTGRQGSRANAWITQLGDGSSSIVTGRTDPIQGWVSFDYGRLLKAPVIDTRANGTHVRFLTLIVPSATANHAPAATGLRWHDSGFDLTIGAGGAAARISVRDVTAWVRAF